MRNLLALFAAIALTFVGVGWYLDWFHVQSAPTSGGHREISIDVNTDKLHTDLSHATQEVLKEANKKVQNSIAQQASNGLPPPPSNP